LLETGGFFGFLMAGISTPISGKSLKFAGTDKQLHRRYPWAWDSTDCGSPAGNPDVSSRSQGFWISGRRAQSVKAGCADKATSDVTFEVAWLASLRT